MLKSIKKCLMTLLFVLSAGLAAAQEASFSVSVRSTCEFPLRVIANLGNPQNINKYIDIRGINPGKTVAIPAEFRKGFKPQEEPVHIYADTSVPGDHPQRYFTGNTVIRSGIMELPARGVSAVLVQEKGQPPSYIYTVSCPDDSDANGFGEVLPLRVLNNCEKPLTLSVSTWSKEEKTYQGPITYTNLGPWQAKSLRNQSTDSYQAVGIYGTRPDGTIMGGESPRAESIEMKVEGKKVNGRLVRLTKLAGGYLLIDIPCSYYY